MAYRQYRPYIETGSRHFPSTFLNFNLKLQT
ncbi:Hypothetical protein Nlim_1673 [Candidatus Nitrosarchaeum limnium SFB1]|uniref:Uncharacterized protein n=1 Tax=Candidatus Nitrosarchaeum limnium SFB1 TaxID=886738 RepID=F3KMC4_9ARCH|nr:Hypothetical protein Nlim_1673 [Candidatus Nitrosarchaeum limnium SFB1]